MKTQYERNKIIKALALMVMAASLVAGCSDDELPSQSFENIGGMLSRNDKDAVPLFINTKAVSWHGEEHTVTVILANDWITGTGNGQSFESMQTISFTVPDDQLGEELELNDDNATMSEHVPERFPENAPVKEEFLATHAEGKITLFTFWDDPALLNPDHANGIFEVTFTDDDGNTRKIEKGFFNF